MEFFGIDWHELFVPQMPLAGIFLRGTMTYIMLFMIMRFLLKRQSYRVLVRATRRSLKALEM